MKFSKRIEDMQASPVRRLVPFAQEAKAKGKKVYHLNVTTTASTVKSNDLG